MKKPQIVLRKKTYSKAEPTVKDWLDYYEGLKIYKERVRQGHAENECAFDMVFLIIGCFFDIQEEEILTARLASSVIERVFKDIQVSILESFNRAPSTDIDDLMDSRMEESIMTMAADMFFRHGVLPADFFNQPLAALNKVLGFTSSKMKSKAEADEIDNSKF